MKKKKEPDKLEYMPRELNLVMLYFSGLLTYDELILEVDINALPIPVQNTIKIEKLKRSTNTTLQYLEHSLMGRRKENG